MDNHAIRPIDLDTFVEPAVPLPLQGTCLERLAASGVTLQCLRANAGVLCRAAVCMNLDDTIQWGGRRSKALQETGHIAGTSTRWRPEL